MTILYVFNISLRRSKLFSAHWKECITTTRISWANRSKKEVSAAAHLHSSHNSSFGQFCSCPWALLSLSLYRTHQNRWTSRAKCNLYKCDCSSVRICVFLDGKTETGEGPRVSDLKATFHLVQPSSHSSHISSVSDLWSASAIWIITCD